MGDAIFFGVLRMPPDLWSDDPLDQHQRYSRYVQAADEIEALRAEVERLRDLVPSPVDAPERGDYVLATKWSDGDPGDPWGVGFYDGESDGRLFVVDSNRKQIRLNGYRAAARISKEVGRWLLENSAALEAGALESGAKLNLWGMLEIAPYRAKRPKRRNGGDQ